ncbi:acetoacetate--CoA ligase [Paraconexibacter antarcticus]|uniref:Acetoacetate--CoA ligase n=1 Tax=Paraconexibacter antarcticus TaxID=2949664 RepID=A0ABY5DWZ8_9ACTN|nr:acetoacetate--CoA ligase [Paraconexibacter antarcticus]UTI65402.1 acetoacetate--CoA ligase [Paraconexibacter antarcticus]
MSDLQTPAVAPLWTAPPDMVEAAEMTALMREVGATDYNELWEWSVADVERFWRTLWDRYELQADGDPTRVLDTHEMPGARWFPDVALSFPEHVFRGKDPAALALQFAAEERPLQAWTWAQLTEEVTRIRAGLAALGVERGDRVAGYLPNIPHTVAAFLATTSLGAIWSCCSPDFGTRTVVDRFAQIEPKVLLAVDGYRYGGKAFDRTQIVHELAAALPTVERTIVLPYLGTEGGWAEAFPATEEPLAFERVPFDHPLWIVYSSGTTGLPKPIVHGHGGPLLEHLKTWRLHQDNKPGDRVLWFTTTGWIMWNYLVCGLLSDVSIVLYDGNPGYPSLDTLWDVADESGAALFGAGAAFIHGCMRAGVEPAQGRELANLRCVGVTGSPLAPEGFSWIAEHVGPHIWTVSTSGGTDIAGGFFGGAPLMPVHVGELSARMLGVKVEAWDDDGRAVVDEVGELVVTEPMPSMPVKFWNDAGGERYRDSYFELFPGVWRHGDWIRITARGSAIIYGRSDSTINRGGIRMGTAEIYAAVLAVDGIADALAVDVPPASGTGDSWLGLFVVLEDGVELTPELTKQVAASIRSDASPRHVPDELVAAPDLPKTLTGKLLEVPIKKLMMGRDPGSAANAGSLANPEALQWFVDWCRKRGPVA